MKYIIRGHNGTDHDVFVTSRSSYNLSPERSAALIYKSRVLAEAKIRVLNFQTEFHGYTFVLEIAK